MSLKKYISEATVAIEYEARTKTAILVQIVRLFKQKIPDLDEEQTFNLFWQREQMGSTAIGYGSALPHIRSPNIQEPYCSLIRLAYPIDFGGVDRQPVDLFFALIVPDNQQNTHLSLLKEICQLLNQEHFRKACRLAQTVPSLKSLLQVETMAAELI